MIRLSEAGQGAQKISLFSWKGKKRKHHLNILLVLQGSFQVLLPGKMSITSFLPSFSISLF